MLIKRVDKRQFDVFFDEHDSKGKIIPSGWENWCRFEIVSDKGSRSLKKVKGRSVPPEIMVFLRKKFERK